MVLSAKASGNMAANYIAPDLCERKCCLSSYAGCGLQFLHIRRKNFTVAPPVNNQNDCVYVPATTRMWRTANQLLRIPAWLSVNHWWYQLLSQGWGAQVWCLWQLLPWWTVVVTIAASDPHLLFLNRCVFVDFFHAFLCTFSCVFVINKNAFLWSVNALS